MKKAVSLTIGVALVVFCAAAALAGIGPSWGLPTVNLAVDPNDGAGSPDNNFYQNTDTAVAGRVASVMCVACHTRNPGFRTAYRVANGWAAGSHFVTRNFLDTSEGGGYSDSTQAASGKNALRSNRLDNPIYMATGTPATWAAAPRYAQYNGSDNVLENTNAPDTATYRAQMICESCHSIVANIGPAKLLARGFSNDNAALCVGCHGDMDPVVSAEWQYHPSDNTWAGTAHHRNSHSVDADTRYYSSFAGSDLASGTYEMATMQRSYWNGYGGGTNYQMWSVNYGTLADTSRAIQWTGERMLAAGDNNQISPLGNPTGIGGGTLICTNCHRAHNADASMGATILSRGPDVTTSMGYLPLTPTDVQASEGVRTMNDRGGRAASVDTLNPMCLVCHR